MLRENKSKLWNDMKVSEIAASIALTYNLATKIDDTNTKHSVIEQFEENDFDFLCRLAKENGFEFYVQNGIFNFKKPDYSLKPITSITPGYDLISFSGVLDIADQTTEVADAIGGANPTNWNKCFTKASGECPGDPRILPGKNIELKGMGKALSKDYYVEGTVHTMAPALYNTVFHVKQMI
jgi:phage protein D